MAVTPAVRRYRCQATGYGYCHPAPPPNFVLVLVLRQRRHRVRTMTTRRIKNWLPIKQISVAAIRKGGALAQAAVCNRGWNSGVSRNDGGKFEITGK